MNKILIWCIEMYRAVTSNSRPRCRYMPTCSQYALTSIKRHGTARGVWLASKRLLRCHPFGSFGLDPVPEKRGTSV